MIPYRNIGRVLLESNCWERIVYMVDVTVGSIDSVAHHFTFADLCTGRRSAGGTP